MPNSTRTASSSHSTDHSSSTGHTGPAGHKEPKRGGHHPATIKPAKPHSDKAHTDKVHTEKVHAAKPHVEKVHTDKPHADKPHTEKAHAEKSKPELVRRGPAMMAEPVQVAPVTHPAKAAHTTHTTHATHATHATHSAHAPAAHAATAAAATHIHVMPAAAASVTAVAGTATSVTFASIGLDAKLLKALGEEGYHTPTPIQAKAIGPVMAGNDVLGCAQTGTGKTAAFALPILHKLLSTPRAISTASGGQAHSAGRGTVIPRVLILSPTRELAVQIAESFSTYGRHSGLTHVVIYGGVSQFNQVKALQRGVDIIVATPGRLMDLMQQRHLNLTKVEVFILDEADRMLDMGFIEPIRQIARSIPSPRQTLMFSATMPREIMHLADSLLKNPVKVSVTPGASAAPLIEQSAYAVPRFKKQALLTHLVTELKIARAIVFTRTKHGADKVCTKLLAAGITAEAIHGNKAQNRRQRSLDAFKSGRARCLVATDVAARGLDVDGISHVFNFDVPNEPESYVHRIGRTGRAGNKGVAITFCDPEEHGFMRAIERLTGKRIPQVEKLPALEVERETPSSNDERRSSFGAGRPSFGGGNRSSYGGGGGGSGSGGGGGGGGRREGGRDSSGPSSRDARSDGPRDTRRVASGTVPNHAAAKPHASRVAAGPMSPRDKAEAFGAAGKKKYRGQGR